jgi:hypothetical protein
VGGGEVGAASSYTRHQLLPLGGMLSGVELDWGDNVPTCTPTRDGRCQQQGCLFLYPKFSTHIQHVPDPRWGFLAAICRLFLLGSYQGGGLSTQLSQPEPGWARSCWAECTHHVVPASLSVGILRAGVRWLVLNGAVP